MAKPTKEEIEESRKRVRHSSVKLGRARNSGDPEAIEAAQAEDDSAVAEFKDVIKRRDGG